MIVVKLMGGLGNQMFQYALGRYLAHKNNTKLLLDLSFLKDKTPRENFTYRDFELGVFNIKASFATNKDVDFFISKDKGFKKLLFKIQKKIRSRSVVREQHFHFDPQIINTNSPSYLEGYFQSEKYFLEVEDIIREDFEFRSAPSESAQKWLTLIHNSNAVSMHFRRGDFLANKEVLKHHGTCSVEYYRKAEKIIKKKVEDPTFFIFSDDINWVKDNFEIEGKHYFVENNNAPAYEDLRLMSACRYNIIANSTFSWWGAWLNSFKDKVVIAPAKFLSAPDYNLNDVIPDGWIKI